MSQQRTRAEEYSRVSTVGQAEHGSSLKAPEAKVRAYAEPYDLDLVAVEVMPASRIPDKQTPRARRPPAP